MLFKRSHGLNLIQAWIFLRYHFHNWLSCVHNCDVHSCSYNTCNKDWTKWRRGIQLSVFRSNFKFRWAYCMRLSWSYRHNCFFMAWGLIITSCIKYDKFCFRCIIMSIINCKARQYDFSVCLSTLKLHCSCIWLGQPIISVRVGVV